LSWYVTENVKLVDVVPEPGEADPFVRLPLSGHDTASTGTTNIGSSVKSETPTAIAIARSSRALSPAGCGAVRVMAGDATVGLSRARVPASVGRAQPYFRHDVRRPAVPYTVEDNSSYWDESVPEPTDPAPDQGAAASANIRRRTIQVMAVEFVLLMGVAAIQGFWPGAGGGHGLAVLFLALCALTVPYVMARLTSPILRDLKQMEEERARLVDLYGQAREDSLLDGLTGLGNHRAFQEELSRQLEQASRHGTALALLLVDVDDLKKVNDEQGHAVGDQLLAAMGRITLGAVRRGDRAYRVGGDEFAVILPNADIETGLVVARRMLASALTGMDSGPTQCAPFSLSIGISAFPAPSTLGDLLYRHADAALYWCKQHGRTNAAAYDPGRHGALPDERSIEDLSAALGAILSRRALRPVYQPIFSMTTGDVIGYEGLIRPTDLDLMPDANALFAAAERADRTVELDMACLEAIADGLSGLPEGVYLSVNVSPRTLESDQFHPTEVSALFARHGVGPKQIVIELTEREEVQDLPQLRRNAAACAKAGMRLAADDVGAGNAGLRLLSEIHFDIVKIDLSLVQGGILHDPSHGILRALQELAARWSAAIVAEGVETSEQLAVIRELGITSGQGYLLGRPDSDRRAERLDLDALMPQGGRRPRSKTGARSRITGAAPEAATASSSSSAA
jgi:diguanylate cyclase (GGDEF)-like protein